MSSTNNKVKFGLKNCHYAKATLDPDTNAVTFGTPVAIPGAVNLSLDPEGDTEPFYADDMVYYTTVANNGYSGDLEMALIPEWFRTDILQEEKDSNGVLIERSDVTESVYFALLFEFDGDVRAIRHVLYNCKASRPTLNSETTGETIEPVTETLTIRATARDYDHLVKAKCKEGDTSYSTFFSAVVVPTI